ncbi:response regulator transcription factor [Clostridium akagii]|uniref:response regulator transcription factor n=1 Tax=Clostridium akagii TaxID=91623 RepID=UPI00047E08E1|nr:response regulator transcription factor [Clostridium akagii]
MKKILIIEDDVLLRKYIEEYLVGYDYEVQIVTDFNNVKEETLKASADLVLLDINLPKFDGFYFLKAIRNKLTVPVIIVSARSSEGEQIRGMNMGADDYVTKRFNMGILVAKINAVLRRTNTDKNNSIKINDIMLICESMQLKANNKIIELSKNEYKLLKIFMSNYNKVVSREELLEELWDDTVFVDDNTLTVNITRLKKRLDQVGVKESIITKRGIGYVFT